MRGGRPGRPGAPQQRQWAQAVPAIGSWPRPRENSTCALRMLPFLLLLPTEPAQTGFGPMYRQATPRTNVPPSSGRPVTSSLPSRPSVSFLAASAASVCALSRSSIVFARLAVSLACSCSSDSSAWAIASCSADSRIASAAQGNNRTRGSWVSEERRKEVEEEGPRTGHRPPTCSFVQRRRHLVLRVGCGLLCLLKLLAQALLLSQLRVPLLPRLCLRL